MMQVLKVIGRVFLIGFGLICITSGGLCTIAGLAQGLGTIWFGLIGLFFVVVGVAVIRSVFKKWKQEMQEASGEETP